MKIVSADICPLASWRKYVSLSATVMLAVMILALSACASRLEQGLPLLQGRSIDQAIAYLGHPHGETMVAGRKVYSWYDEYAITSYDDDFSPHGGLGLGFGSHRGVGMGMGFGIPFGPGYRRTDVYRCTVRAITDQRGIIVETDYTGSQASCQKFGNRINTLIMESQQPPMQRGPQRAM